MSEQSKDITTLKVYSDQKDEVNLIASRLGEGAGQKEVMTYLLSLEKVHQAKEIGKEVPRLDDIIFHFSRIEGIYTEYALTSKDREHLDSEIINQLKENIELLKLQVYDRKLELESLNEILQSTEEKYNNDLKVEFDKFETELTKLKGEFALAKENYVKELDNTKELLLQVREAKEQSDKLVKLAQDAAELSNQRLMEFTEKASGFDKLQEENKSLHEELSKLMVTLKEREVEVKNTQDRANIEKDKGLFEIEKKYIEQVSQLREELSKARESYAELKIAFNEKNQIDNK